MPSSLMVRSSLNYFPVHQFAASNFMHLKATYTLHLQHLFNRRRMWNPIKHLLEPFAEIVDIFRPLAIFAEELHRGCLTGF